MDGVVTPVLDIDVRSDESCGRCAGVPVTDRSRSQLDLRDMFSRLAALCGVVVAIACIACGSTTEAPTSDFTIRVDSISGPTAVSGGIAAEQRLWGVVGAGGCTAFKALSTTRVPSRLDVTVIGEHVPGGACRQDTVTLGGLVVRIEPIIPEDFSLVVHQPDGSTLVRRILGE